MHKQEAIKWDLQFVDDFDHYTELEK